ncbi:integral membrane protein [Moelleriella libera RCEF 2490]|uniref:Integral membrane protein n=1 Tax=Moelleriella libera RCEF 2490 TaxID=1081109 RepID=A0A167Z1V5_9HYPO|nr:integral membrane protein [Moelleriella libera RCEF 2490]
MEPPTALPIDLSENLQPNLYASSTIPFSIAFLCVLLRFWCRWTKNAGFWLDDWLLCGAFVCAAGLTADLLWWIPHGLGRHIETFGSDVMLYWSIGLFTAEMTYTGVIVLVKFSILALYWRIFGTHTSIKLPVVLMSAAVAMWGLAVFETSAAAKSVAEAVPSHLAAMRPHARLLGQDDPVVLQRQRPKIPLCHLDPQHIDRRDSLGVACSVCQQAAGVEKSEESHSFNVPSRCVCIASIMRLISVVNQKNNADKSWDYINQAIWATTEADFAIISASISPECHHEQAFTVVVGPCRFQEQE